MYLTDKRLFVILSQKRKDYVRKENTNRSGLPVATDHEPDRLKMEVVYIRRITLQADATPRVLDLQLKELVEDGLVGKTIFPELPPRSEYSITPLGMTLIPIIDAMLEWGEKNKALFERKHGKK